MANSDSNSSLSSLLLDKIKEFFSSKIDYSLISNTSDVVSSSTSVDKSLGLWGDFGVLIGQLAGNIMGGNIGTAVSRAATGTQTSINAVKNLNALKGLDPKKNKGLNTARAGNIASLAGAASGVADAFLGERSEYSGDYGAITLTIDQVYDGISDAAMSMGPIGMLVGGAMKTADLLGDGLGKLGGGTDGMTTGDAILGSSLFSWNVGLINGFGGSKTDSITKNEDTFATIGSSYSGSNNTVDDALNKSNKKYGLFSSHLKSKANLLIADAKFQQLRMEGIANQAIDRFNLQGSMSAINANRREYDMMGGYNNIRVGKLGLKFSLVVEGELPIPLFKIGGELPKLKSIKIEGELPELKVISFLFGGEIPSSKYLNFVESLPDNLKPKENDHYNMKLLWELNGKPESFNDVKGIIFTYDKGDKLWHAPSVTYDENSDEYIFLKSPEHPTYEKELEWYYSNNPEAVEFRKNYKYNPSLNKYLPIKSNKIDSFKNGGEFNVIPEGALHKNKHHIDMDGITKKGIPVVTDDGELTAEIEKDEIIFRLQVTETLEKLYKIYNSEDSKLKDKDEAALEAGKLLVYEILHNTIDNTNLINKI